MSHSGAAVVDGIQIVAGYRPGAIGRIAQLHGEYYAAAWRFAPNFEADVAREVAAFVESFDPAKDGLWLAMHGSSVEGSIAIMAAAAPRLRWFIVSDAIRGKGVGKALMHAAMSFCDEHRYGRVDLWTFKGLDAAIGLYEAHGFRLAEERDDDTWGVPIRMERFVRRKS